MRNRLGAFLGLALALVAVTATHAGADSRFFSLPSRSSEPPQPFTLSGPCSGPIAGEIRIDGVSYRLARDARVYEVGRGFVPIGTAFYDRVLCISGMKWRNTVVVYNVLVRPALDPAANLAARSPAGVHEGARPE